MKVLVTGSEGSLMQAVIPRLVAQGHDIIGIDNLFNKFTEPKAPMDDYKLYIDLKIKYKASARKIGYDFYIDDASDYSSLSNICQNWGPPDIIFQAAARIYGVGGFHKYPADILANDVNAHRTVLEIAKAYGKPKVVFISSSMVYEGCKQSKQPLDWTPGYYINGLTEDLIDTNQCNIPRTDYGLSKLVGERLSKAFWQQYEVPYTIWRPFNIITPLEAIKGEIGTSHVFADFIENIVVNHLNPLPIIGDGEQIRSFTWIDDVAQAIADYSFDDKSLNKTFNVGNTEFITMKKLAELIQSIVDPRPLAFQTVKNYSDDVQVRIPNVDKIEKIFGWKTTKNLQQCLEECIEHAGN